MMSMYLREALWIADLVVNKLSDENKLLPKRINAQSGEIIESERMIDDLGDYVQNIWYLGKILGDKRLMDFVLTSAYNAAALYHDKSGLFRGAFKNDWRIDWDSNEDVFVGLTSLYKLSRDPGLESIIFRFQQGLARYTDQSGFLFAGCRGPMRYVRIPPKAFVEGFVHIYETNGSREALHLAKRLADPWIKSNFFKRHGLFPTRMLGIDWIYNLNEKINRYKLRNLYSFGGCDIPKTNTNFLQGILELWKVTSDMAYVDSMRKWIDSAEVNLIRNDIYASYYNVYSYIWLYNRKPIAPLIAILSFYADFCKTFKDEKIQAMLELRVRNVLKAQTDIGFFRDAPHDTKDPKYKRGVLDCQTDMSVLLLKVYSLTKNASYLEASKRCIDNVIRHLKRPFGYIEYFNAINGNADYHSRMYMKFLTLFIKALVLLDSVLSGKDIFQDELFIISADR